MIGIDTNALLRLVLLDDEAQVAQVRDRLARALAERETVWIGPVTLAETVWTLARRRKVARAAITVTVDGLLDARPLRVFDEPVVRRALNLYTSERAGFSDCLILATNETAGCERTITFDRMALRLDHFVHPAD